MQQGMGGRRHGDKPRLLHPHVRGADGALRRATWDEAVSAACSRLCIARTAHGPACVLPLLHSGRGAGLLASHLPQRLWAAALGATAAKNTLCEAGGDAALALHYGSTGHSAQPEAALGAPLVVFWGLNAAVSAPELWALATARPSATRVVVVDPRATPTTESAAAPLWLRPRPGADAAVAYALAARIVRRGAADAAFLARHAAGFDAFCARCLSDDVERAAAASGVDGAQLDALAELYATRRPSVTMIGVGLQRTQAGAEAVRAVSLLPSILGMHRGFFFNNFYPFDSAYLSTGAKSAVTSAPAAPAAEVSQSRLGPLLAEGAFKFVYAGGMDPARVLPDSAAVRKGLARDDCFVVVHSTYMNETCSLADVVLPACTLPETDDVEVHMSSNRLQLTRSADIPEGAECRSEIEVMRMFAEKLELTKEFPALLEPPMDALRVALRGACIDVPEGEEVDRLLRGEEVRMRPYPSDLYRTPSGKIEFFSSVAESLGLSPLPVLTMPSSSQQQDDAQCCGGGGGRHSRGFILMNSADPRHEQGVPQSVHVNKADAAKLGIETGTVVSLENRKGEVHLRALVTESVPEGCVWTAREAFGLNGQTLNVLTGSESTLSFGEAAAYQTHVSIRVVPPARE